MKRNTRVTLCILAALVAGCTRTDVDTEDADGSSSGLGTMELIPRTDNPILDIPVPIGFELADRSRNWSGAGVRFVEHIYEGRADKFAVVRFYRRYMERKGWTLMRNQFAQGRSTLSFEKKTSGLTEECTVSVSEAGLWDKVRIAVAVGPRGPMAIPAPSNQSRP